MRDFSLVNLLLKLLDFSRSFLLFEPPLGLFFVDLLLELDLLKLKVVDFILETNSIQQIKK